MAPLAPARHALRPPPPQRLAFERGLRAQFVNMMSRPMVERAALEKDVADTFPQFAGEESSSITASSLMAAMAEVGKPIEPLVADEMIREATKGGAVPDGKISREEFIALNGIDAKRSGALEVS